MARTRGIWQRAATVAALFAAIMATSEPPTTGALPPPLGRASHGAAGTARNGFGGEIAPSAAGNSWPGTGANRNGGPFAFAGAQYGPMWGIPSNTNNSRGVGYCVMEDVTGEGKVSLRPDPSTWSKDEAARAAAVMATFGGDRVVPYGINDAGALNVITGEWENPLLFGGGEFTRRRQVAVNFGMRMFLEDLSPRGVAGGHKLARDTAVVNGGGGEFAALRNGYQVAQYMARVADRQSAVGGVRLKMVWGTPDGSQPTMPGTYPLQVHVTDSTGKRVGLVPVLQLSDVGIGGNRSSHAVARVDNRADAPADLARWNAATASGWPVWEMNAKLDTDRRFTVGSNPRSADVADGKGVARFHVEITGAEWELAFHVQAPTSNVDLYAGNGIQGQVTWSGLPQSASVHERFVVPERFITISKTSSDAAVAVTGTVFGLYDGSGDEIEQAIVGTDGLASFGGFSPATFEPPYVLREVSVAPGLEPIIEDIAVPALRLLSTDAASPTVIDVRNVASAGRFRVRKVLDDADVQGARDMSGFAFEVTQVATGSVVGKFTTGAGGSTEWAEAVLGDYEIVEVDRPVWAEALIDPGPVTFHFDPTASKTEITYTNLVPEVEITTLASDPVDGDKFVVLPGIDRLNAEVGRDGTGGTNGTGETSGRDGIDGTGETNGTGESNGADRLNGTGNTNGRDGTDGTGETNGPNGNDEIDGPDGSGDVLDVVSYCGLVPGTGYSVSGTIQVFTGDPSPVPAGVTGSTTFVPAATCGKVEVTFDVPEGSVLLGNVGVVFEQLTLTATGAVVAEHADPGDEAQMLFFPSISTDLHVADEDPSGSQGPESDVRADADHSRSPTESDGRADVDRADGSGDFLSRSGPGDSDEPTGSDRAVIADGTDASDRPDSSAGAAHSFNGHIGVAGSRLVDVVTYSGLATDVLYRAELALYQRGREGQCVATNIVTSMEFTANESSGAVIVAGAIVPAPGVYVGYERIYRVRDGDDNVANDSSAEDGSGSSVSSDDAKNGFRAENPIDADRSGDTLVASHENCDDQAQTVWALGMETAVAQSVSTGSGEMTDTITISGLADGLPEGTTAVVEGALHHHSGPDRSKWACNADSLVEQFTLDVDSDGDYRSPGERHGIGWHSYDNRFVVSFEDGANWRSEWFGCGVEAESFEARPPDHPPTTPRPPFTSPPVTSRPPDVQQPPAAPPRPEPPPPTTPPHLPKTGGDDSARVQLLAILLVLVGGSLYLFTPASALPFPRRRQFRDLCQQIRERHR